MRHNVTVGREGIVVIDSVEHTLTIDEAMKLANDLYSGIAAFKDEQLQGKVVDAEMPFPIASTPAKPKHNVALLFAGGVLVDVRIVEGAPAKIQAEFVYHLQSEQPIWADGYRGAALCYVLKERV